MFGLSVCLHYLHIHTKRMVNWANNHYRQYYFSSAGAEEQVKVRDAGNGVYECEYYPLKPGKYTVSITWGGQPIPRR